MRELLSVKYGIRVPLLAMDSRFTSLDVNGKSLSTLVVELPDQPAYWRVVVSSRSRSRCSDS